MYHDLFDDQRQMNMRNYFLQDLSRQGIIKKYKKKELIDLAPYQCSFAIVLKGKVIKSIVSSSGQEKILYTLRPGEIFGEMALFSGGFLNYQIRIKEDAEVSYIKRDVLACAIHQNPDVYQFLINSITRKFRIVLLQLTNTTFNDSTGRIADALIRLAACADRFEVDKDSHIISTIFTQNELAHNVGCSRITVSRTLKRFLQEDLIGMKNKRIVIKDLDGLARYTDKVQ